MKAVEVFGLVIGYLRNHLMQRLKNRDNQNVLQEDMIQWVLTVPAIWHDKAKQFMRRAAEMVKFNFFKKKKKKKWMKTSIT